MNRGPGPRAVRTFYALADALYPPEDGEPGAGDVDLAPALERWLVSSLPARRARVLRGLAWIEWAPLAFGARSTFSWLPRDARRAMLRRLERAPLAELRRTAGDLREAAAAAWLRRGGASASHSPSVA